RARRHREQLEPDAADRGGRALERAVEGLGEARALIGGDWGARLRVLGEGQDAGLQRRRGVGLVRVTDDELDRAATDVHHERTLAAEVQRRAGAQVDEVRFFVATDDGELDTGLVANDAHEVAAVLGFADGRRRDRDDRVDAGALGDAAEAPDRL